MTDTTDSPKQRTWGPLAAVGVGLMALLGAEIIAAIVLSMVVAANGGDPVAIFDKMTPLQEFLFAWATAALGVAIVYSFVRTRGGWASLGLGPISWKRLAPVVPVWLLYFALSVGIFALIKALAPGIDLEEAQELGFRPEELDVTGRILAGLALLVAVPLKEEIVFRGLLFKGLRRWGFWVAAILSSAVFAVAHGIQINLNIDTFLMGLASCWLLERTGSLWASVALHTLKNTLAFYFVFVVG